MCRKVNNYIIEHNDANVCIIGIESIGIGLSASVILSYLQSGFDNE
jgi:ribose 5-phosphate isomerase RpiB